METVEIIIYFVIAIVVGALIIAFIRGWNTQSTFESIKQIFRPTTTQYETLDNQDLPRAALALWEACGLGSTDMNKTVYIPDAVPLNKTLIFEQVKAANLCRSLQWNESGCGTRDDVVFADTNGPVVLQLRCDAATQKLIILS